MKRLEEQVFVKLYGPTLVSMQHAQMLSLQENRLSLSHELCEAEKWIRCCQQCRLFGATYGFQFGRREAGEYTRTGYEGCLTCRPT